MEPFLNAAIRQLRICAAAAVVGVAAGLASAAFLIALDAATSARVSKPWLFCLLPIGGFAIGWAYWKAAGRAGRGAELVIEEIHAPTHPIPLRMAPFVFVGTVATHVFGGSAGREGAAVQMAASLGDQAARLFRFGCSENRSILLMASLAAGFGAVFGTPWAGAVFGLEAPWRRGTRGEALLPCLLASFVGDAVVMSLGVTHAHYAFAGAPIVSSQRMLAVAAMGAALGALGGALVWTTEKLRAEFARRVPWPPLRPVVGGLVVLAIVTAFGGERALGLGVHAIVESTNGIVPPSDFAWKFLLTALTIGAGFKGGEVTPLFFMGATGGNALARWMPASLGLSAPFLSAVGFAAAFAGAAHVPLTCTMMSVEVFGRSIGPYAAAACVSAFLASRLAISSVGLHRRKATPRE